jgi:two-component system sensor histidine kinase AlgZ
MRAFPIMAVSWHGKRRLQCCQPPADGRQQAQDQRHRPFESDPDMRKQTTDAPLDALWQAPVIIRVLVAGEALAMILALAPGVGDNRWVHFGLISLMAQWISLSTLGALYLARRLLVQLPPLWIANIALLILMVVNILVCTASWLVVRDLWGAAQNDWAMVFLRFTVIILTSGLLGLAIFQNHWRARQLVLRAKQAELDALQARIHPHFLFNTLNTGAALVHQQPEKAEELLLDLADLFRAALTGSRRIPLREELELARRYAGIEQLRFGARMQLEWQVPEALPDLEVPILSIQPLVENAIHHGVEPSPGPCTLRIAIQPEGGGVRITVSNDLPATPATAHRGHHVGLQALRARIQAMGGDVQTQVADDRYLASMVVPGP